MSLIVAKFCAPSTGGLSLTRGPLHQLASFLNQKYEVGAWSSDMVPIAELDEWRDLAKSFEDDAEIDVASLPHSLLVTSPFAKCLTSFHDGVVSLDEEFQKRRHAVGGFVKDLLARSHP